MEWEGRGQGGYHGASGLTTAGVSEGGAGATLTGPSLTRHTRSLTITAAAAAAIPASVSPWQHTTHGSTPSHCFFEVVG